MKNLVLGRKSVLLASVLLIALIAAPTAAGATAALTPSSGGASQTWAYGGQEWENTTILTSAYIWEESYFYGWQVVQTATNTTSSITQVSGVDTAAENYFFQYCVPNCTSPTTSENESYVYWSVSSAFANLTSKASVNEAGVPVPAYGILNASSAVRENVSETYSGILNSAPWYSGSYYYNWDSQTGIAFTPALGLVPWNASTNQTWNSSSTYSASGGWAETYLYYSAGATASSIERANLSGADSNTGSESVYGLDAGTVTLSGGASAQAIELGFNGPYNVSDGLFIAPSDSQIFGGATANWSVQVETASAAFTPVLDLSHSSDGALAVVASTTSWTVATRTAAGINLPETVSTKASGTVQAQPEPVPYAQSTSKCLLGPCGPASVSPTTSSGYSASWWIAAAAGVGVVAGAGGMWVSRRPRSPSRRASELPGTER